MAGTYAPIYPTWHDVLTQFEFFSHLFEAGERTFQGPVVDAVRDTEISRRAEALTGHNQNIPLTQLVDKGNIILQRRLREHIESPLRLHHRIAHLDKIVVQQIPFPLIIIYRDSNMLEILYQVLHSGRRH